MFASAQAAGRLPSTGAPDPSRIPRDAPTGIPELPGRARPGAALPPAEPRENTPINTLPAFLFVGTTPKEPPGQLPARAGGRPPRQVPRPGAPSSRADPARPGPAQHGHSPRGSPGAHIPTGAARCRSHPGAAAAAPPEALHKHWRVTGRPRAEPSRDRRGGGGSRAAPFGRGEPLRRGRPGRTTAGGRGRSARSPRAAPVAPWKRGWQG